MQPTVFTLPQKTVSVRLDPHALPSLGLASASRYSRSHPQAGAARGMDRPKPGPGRGSGMMLGDMTPATWRPVSPGAIQLVPWEATHSFHAPSEDCFGAGGRHALPSLGLAWASRSSRSHPRAGVARGVATTKPGPGRGPGLMLLDVSPVHMAAGVPRRNPACLLGSNPQSSRSLGRLFRGGWTLMCGPLWA